ncbi:VOC family protein [Deinococcus sp. KNUC1210]|uniref:VOC family protein n=1 Tax=Deinococcus sp. KNUC1210 TaxID=2917691 RepID=UPI001EF15B01|nr:VOC family protein [Deinococcus sp. KNUC1210]ULH16852.1 VOC family protein [Deinococcus sp. KNUC1210]
MAASAQRNIDFYSVVLGQRVVKVTVNFDDPGTYHLYYGDRVGSPGTVMTHFPWQGAARGVRGNGEAVATAYSIGADSLDYWRERLNEHGFAPTETQRFGHTVLSAEDPDGTLIELIVDERAAGLEVPVSWPASPVPAQHALQGFHSVTLWVSSVKPIADLLVGQLGFEAAGQDSDPEGTRYRFRGAGAGVGLYVDAVERPGKPRGRFGAGSIHHVALRTVDDSEQAEYMATLKQAGYQPTPVQDRQYFHSIYFREPNGVLFEIATDAPGFDADESVDELGSHLMLPEWFESKRSAIEQRVPRVVNHEYNVEIGGGTSGRPLQQTPVAEAAATAPQQPGSPSGQSPARDSATRRAGRPLSEARVALVLVHGRGGTADDILQLTDVWNQSVYAYLAPQAPTLPGQGPSWYPQSFLAPVEQNQPALDTALGRLEALMAELAAAGIPAERVMLGGFSQGACLVSEFVARHPQRYGGVFVYSGGLITLEHSGNLAGTPIFMGNSDQDAHVPLERFQQSADLLTAMGGNVDARVYPGMPHTIVQEELDAVGRMMQSLAFESV